MIQKIKQYFCKHTFKCLYIYGTFAEWKCKKCGKCKKGFAPVGFSNEDLRLTNKNQNENNNPRKSAQYKG